jgi:hypothetical protein
MDETVFMGVPCGDYRQESLILAVHYRKEKAIVETAGGQGEHSQAMDKIPSTWSLFKQPMRRNPVPAANRKPSHLAIEKPRQTRPVEILFEFVHRPILHR